MPYGLCNKWIDGDWMYWRQCFATPTEGNRILVHTSSDANRDLPCVIHFVLSRYTEASWYFFCQDCRVHLEGQGGFPIHSCILMRVVQVSGDYPWSVPMWPVLVYLFQSPDSDSWSDSDSNSWDEGISDESQAIIIPRTRACKIPRAKVSDHCTHGKHHNSTPIRMR